MTNTAQAVFEYHQRSKHQLKAYAKGPETVDWDDQPNPYRYFKDSEIVKLPLPGAELPVLFSDLDKPGQIPPLPLSLENLGLMLELAFGLSGWRQIGPDRWAIRCNPSSGCLHPTEVYLISTDPTLLEPGAYHYVSYDHHLERRSRFNQSTKSAELFIGLSSIHWREAWNYGERAYRYCLHDAGHALAGLSYAAAGLGWSIELLSEIADADLANWLGLDRLQDFVANELETPDLFCRLQVGPVSTAASAVSVAETLSEIVQSATWFGSTGRLAGRHFYRWPIIDEMVQHTRKPLTIPERQQWPQLALPLPSHDASVSTIIRQRRSAKSFNGKAEPMALADFERMLLALQPNAKPPFTTWNWPPQVHVFLFVHRVSGLAPGLYFLPRDQADLPELQSACAASFSWEPVPGLLDLYTLIPGNVRQSARVLSCHQPIASDSAFSLGMLARFSENIEAEPWRYRQLFWECGLLGQILYLEAEAAGLRSTGIGCYFDDPVHEVLGLTDNRWQSLYHFTVGEQLPDDRQEVTPAYAHLLA